MNKYTYFDRTNDLYDIKKPALAKFLISQGFDRTIIKQWMNDEEYFDESINNSFMGDLEDSTDGEIEDWAKTEMEFYSEGNDWIDESQLTTESLRMQMLAGIITESQYKTKLKKFTILENKFNSATSRLILNENEGEGKHIVASYATNGGTPEVKFARVLADNVMAGYNSGDINGLYSEGEMDANGDEFYASLDMSKKVFASLPNTFTVTAELVDEEPFTFKVTKNGESGYSAEEI